MVIFHSYVSLPEGNNYHICIIYMCADIRSCPQIQPWCFWCFFSAFHRVSALGPCVTDHFPYSKSHQDFNSIHINFTNMFTETASLISVYIYIYKCIYTYHLLYFPRLSCLQFGKFLMFPWPFPSP